MKIYLVQQDIVKGYDTYDSFICVTKNEKEARETNPNGYWKDYYGDWVDFKDIDKVTVSLIGTATKNTKKGVILASFNAG